MKAAETFLISGQMQSSERGALSHQVHQRVVIAADERAAYKLLADVEPLFTPVGHASLEQYKATVAQLEATVRGESKEWKLVKVG